MNRRNFLSGVAASALLPAVPAAAAAAAPAFSGLDLASGPDTTILAWRRATDPVWRHVVGVRHGDGFVSAQIDSAQLLPGEKIEIRWIKGGTHEQDGVPSPFHRRLGLYPK